MGCFERRTFDVFLVHRGDRELEDADFDQRLREWKLRPPYINVKTLNLMLE
jgi:hypothetical protein